MGEFKHGSLTVALPAGVTLPEKAGNLSVEEAKRTARAQRGLVQACEDAALGIELAQDSLALPKAVTPDTLRAAKKEFLEYDALIAQAERTVAVLKQARLLKGAQARALVGLRQRRRPAHKASSCPRSLGSLKPSASSSYEPDSPKPPQIKNHPRPPPTALNKGETTSLPCGA